ncbi:glycosyltransferase family 33 [Lecanosticta acicola]|uniref:Chitobiosyldiphosphodolichol beta-mannosyltransferase n=1 Tax=Lecanosticta acicola TaxID=111012 RepID=A0AAI8YV23_9PEZI|nr:glycosyltransferase family 33 [Lecanosticta acicola]
MTWLEAAWSITVAAAVVCSAVTFILIWFLPTAYSNFHPQHVNEADFPDDAKESPEKSGYGYYQRHKDGDGKLQIDASVQIVVLGDIGRSPRMQYHALSLASHGGKVDIIGYTGAEVHPDIAQDRLITIVPLRPFPQQLQTNSKLLFLLLAPIKVLYQIWSLYHTLAYRTTAAKWMLIQNPPSIPTLAICQTICFLRNTRLVIDWHNFGYSILALRLGPTHPFVRISQWYEAFFSAHGVFAHLCVTNAMARVLKSTWKIETALLPLHDRPADIYQPTTSPQQRAEILHRLPGTATYAEEILQGKCRLLVSSTSWTPDEDFSILLDALVEYSTAVATTTSTTLSADSEEIPSLPNIVAIITGRGPQRAHYLQKISQLTQSQKLQHVVVTTAWLSPSDYAALLSVADLGVSLHTSSSGVDLPMKVVDMFGTGLPVAGWSRYEAWPELVQEGKNGRGFGSAEELARILEELFGGDGETLKRLREGAMLECQRRWNDEWMPVAGKLFQLKP